jgi:hypothetical protein
MKEPRQPMRRPSSCIAAERYRNTQASAGSVSRLARASHNPPGLRAYDLHDRDVCLEKSKSGPGHPDHDCADAEDSDDKQQRFQIAFHLDASARCRDGLDLKQTPLRQHSSVAVIT